MVLMSHAHMPYVMAFAFWRELHHHSHAFRKTNKMELQPAAWGRRGVLLDVRAAHIYNLTIIIYVSFDLIT